MQRNGTVTLIKKMRLGKVGALYLLVLLCIFSRHIVCLLFFSLVDIWSVGCIMAELLTGKTLFPGQDRILYKIFVCFEMFGVKTS